mmetsp:Transcript_22318/g.70501  ORF Transcript_22318/g.70501 Transcript_22318/m.70501 type:complete len:230 (-) Transcript_22318:76-765(-)
MHLLRGNYGLQAAGACPRDGSEGGATASGVRSRPQGGASTANLRASAGAAVSDDVDDILQQVRGNVTAIQNAASAGHEQDAPSSGGHPELGVRQLSRSFSEATWDRPAPGEQEAVPRAAPKAIVRGRYVFSGGAETQVLTGHGGRHAGASPGEQAATGAVLQLSPRPAQAFHERLSGRLGPRGPKAPPRKEATLQSGGAGQRRPQRQGQCQEEGEIPEGLVHEAKDDVG